MPTITYGAAADLRAQLGLDATAIPDARAVLLLGDASDLVDAMLGVWCVDTVTGRKIVQADVEDWQWTKLARASVLLAAELHRDPRLLSGQQYSSVSGPDFSFSGPLGGRIGAQFAALLNDTGLRRLGTRATGGTGGPLLARRFFHTLNPVRRYR